MGQRPETGPHWSCYICNADNRNKQEKSVHKIVDEISNIEVMFIGARVIRKQTGTILAMTISTLDFKNTQLGSVTYMPHAIHKSKRNIFFLQVSIELTCSYLYSVYKESGRQNATVVHSALCKLHAVRFASCCVEKNGIDIWTHTFNLIMSYNVKRSNKVLGY